MGGANQTDHEGSKPGEVEHKVPEHKTLGHKQAVTSTSGLGNLL